MKNKKHKLIQSMRAPMRNKKEISQLDFIKMYQIGASHALIVATNIAFVIHMESKND